MAHNELYTSDISAKVIEIPEKIKETKKGLKEADYNIKNNVYKL